MIDFTLSQNQLKWQKKARRFAEDKIASNVPMLEDNLNARKKLFEEMAIAGFFRLAIPPSGHEIDSIAYLMALKEIAKVDAGVAVAMAVTNMVADVIATHGTSKQQKSYLKAFKDGRLVPAAFALTEVNAGSDAKAVETDAILADDGSGDFIINGEKRFITNADLAGVTIIIARTSKEKQKDHLSAFLVDRGTKGMRVSKIERKLGLLTANLVWLKFENCRLPKSQLLGEIGEGLKIALQALDGGRLGVAAQALGIGTAAYQAALNHAKHRHQFGSPLIDQQAIAFKLADMHMQLSAGELLLLKAAWRRDQGLPYSSEASEAKLFCSEATNQIASEALQIHGGCGYVKDYLVEKYFRDARVTTLYEGTSEIQRMVIARHLQFD